MKRKNKQKELPPLVVTNRNDLIFENNGTLQLTHLGFEFVVQNPNDWRKLLEVPERRIVLPPIFTK